MFSYLIMILFNGVGLFDIRSFEVAEMGAENGCKCGDNCTCDPCNCKWAAAAQVFSSGDSVWVLIVCILLNNNYQISKRLRSVVASLRVDCSVPFE